MPKNVTLREAWSGQADCLHCSLRATVLFANLTERDFEMIHDPIDQYLLKPGNYLYHTGERGEFMFTVRRGALKLVQYLPDGGQRIVRLARDTDVLGLESLVGKPYQQDAIALQTTEICRFPTRVVRDLARENSALYTELMARWQRVLSEAERWLTELSTGSARQRIARLLLYLILDPNTPECELFGRETLGAMLGITTETTSRTIAEFKRQGLITDRGNRRVLLDRRRLQQIAEGT